MELGKDPRNDYVCVSRYELQTEQRGFNLHSETAQKPVFDNDIFMIFDVSKKPDEAKKELCYNDEEIAKYIKWYPLISACSYIRSMRDDPYSAEYIIPQLFIQWVRSEDENAVVGIKYFSCASKYASTLGNNYVFPTMGTTYNVRKNITDYCARLSHRFKLTSPVFIMEYKSVNDCVEAINNDNNLDYIEDYNAGEHEKVEGEYPIPDGVSAIGAFAFYNCSLLTSITIPDSVTNIGDSAFSWCISLTSIIIPDSVTSIGDSAFSWCISLMSITIPNSVTNISDSAFKSCSSLTNITIPDSVTSIDGVAFYDCRSLINITIPDSVISIGEYAFSSCSLLTNITIPDSVTA